MAPGINTIKRLLHAADARHRALWDYRSMLRNLPLDEHAVVLEPQQGRSPDGNIFYILQELASKKAYSHLRLYYVYTPSSKETFVSRLNAYGLLESVELVERESAEYVRLLACAKYLVTDTGFPFFYIKREGQILWNTWHGTPLKKMGRQSNDDYHRFGNMQRNMFLADYLSYPNRYMANVMMRDYMINNLFTGTVLYAGYPRNTAFFSNERSAALRSEFELEGKKVWAYLPTWRKADDVGAEEPSSANDAGKPSAKLGAKNQMPAVAEAASRIPGYLATLDTLLTKDEILYVSLHPMENATLDYSSFRHVRPIPKTVESYEFLNVCDALVTDYSSVMFDFASTNKPIVLFNFDYESYTQSRGMYVDIDNFPFQQVQTPEALVNALRNPQAVDMQAFKEQFCSYESAAATSDLCAQVFFGESRVLAEQNKPDGRKKVLIYAGNLARNGITTSLTNILQTIDTTEYDVYVTYIAAAVRETKAYLKTLPEDISYLPSLGKTNMSLKEKVAMTRFSMRALSAEEYVSVMEPVYDDEIKRLYGSIPFDTVIQFNGYDLKKILLFERFTRNRVQYVHNDMEQEAKKGNTRLDFLKVVYPRFDKVAVVSPGIVDITKRIGGPQTNVVVAQNIFDYKRVETLARRNIVFNPETVSNISVDTLQEWLGGPGATIVSIGRFSVEKQHELLLRAFDSLVPKHPLAHLVIIGGGSNKDIYHNTRKLAARLKYGNRVALIRNMANPFAVLARCDGLILPSKYEGFGLVLIEADTLSKPVVSTNIDGPRSFMEEHGGVMVEPTLEGITEGLELLLEGKVRPLYVDYEAYNKQAIEQFNSLLS